MSDRPLMSGEDPFDTFRDQVGDKLRGLQTLVEDWRLQLQSCNTAEDARFISMNTRVKKELKNTDELVAMLVQVLQRIEQERQRFAHVDDLELQQRRQFVERVQRDLAAARQTVEGSAAQQKLQADREAQRRKQAERQRSAAAAGMSSYQREHGDFVGSQRARQQQLVRQQDQHLEEMGDSVLQLGHMARNINIELGEQDKLIRDLDNEVDDAQNGLDRAVAGIEKLLQTKDRCQLCLICGMILVVLILAIVAFS